jgi:hypothetical protein
MEFEGPIESFFKSPKEKASRKGDCILYHLRTDLESLYGREKSYRKKSPNMLLAMIGILAGIDFLSNIYSTSNTRSGFTSMIKDLWNLTTDDSEALYQLRCALVHKYALSIISSSYNKGRRFSFEITDKANSKVITQISTSQEETKYRVSFWEMKRLFEKTIKELYNICKNSQHKKNVSVLSNVGQFHTEKILKIHHSH